MQIKFLGTGSAGNCIAIQTETTTILIDIGINKTQVEKKLIENGVNPGDIDAIFLTHAHGDHVKGLPLAQKWDIPVYASEGTWKSIPDHLTKYSGFTFDIPSVFQLQENLFVGSFRTHHDDYDSYGYVIWNDEENERVSVCLDTGHIDAEMLEAMRGSDVYIIEANHDVDMLMENQDRPESVKQRILSDVGHLSNVQTAEALSKIVTGNGEKIYLAHLSGANNMPMLAASVVNAALFKKDLRNGVHYFLEVV